jgi:glycerate kinase
MRTAIIESATVIGLAMLPSRKFHPFDLDTFGLAAVLRAASVKGARRCLIGIGGSATNDGGFGLARGLGWQFLNHNGHSIEQWTGLGELCKIRPPRRRKFFQELVVAVDVGNPLLGPRGATRVYGPQKGIAPREFAMAEKALGRLAHVAKRIFEKDFARVHGAGAAGGLGFGLLAFAGAEVRPGFDVFARHAKLARHLRSADLVITGEGAIDDSTMMGKGAGQLARRCQELGLPCIGLAGAISPETKGGRLFTEMYGLTEMTTLTKAKRDTAFWLERLARKAARTI